MRRYVHIVSAAVFAVLLATASNAAQVTIGATTQNGSPDGGNTGWVGAKLTKTGANAAGYTVADCKMWIGTAAGQKRCTIYTKSGTVGVNAYPGNVVCYGPETTPSGSSAFLSIGVPASCGTLTANTDYWILWNGNDMSETQGIETTTGPGWQGTYTYHATATTAFPASGVATYPGSQSLPVYALQLVLDEVSSGTATPTNTPTNTPTGTPTNTPTATPTITPTPTTSSTPALGACCSAACGDVGVFDCTTPVPGATPACPSPGPTNYCPDAYCAHR